MKLHLPGAQPKVAPAKLNQSASPCLSLPIPVIGDASKNSQSPRTELVSGPLGASKPKTNFKLLGFQEEVASQAYNLLSKNNSAILIAPTGTGKAFFIAEMCYRLREHSHYHNEAQPIIILTKKSVITQTRRVIALRGVKNVIVCSYDQIRSTIGTAFLQWKTRIVNDIPIEWPVWYKDGILKPCLIITDECQCLKNEDSLQHKCIMSYVEDGGQVFFASATPGSRPKHFKCICVALGCCSSKNWASWVKAMSAPKQPEEYCPAAIRRIREGIEQFTIRFHNIKYEHQTRIRQLLINFETLEKFRIYREAFNEYQEAREKAERNALDGMAALFVAILKFRQKSEILRADTLARLAHEECKQGKNVIIATAFTETLKVIHTILIETYGYTQDSISTIIGGQSEKERQTNIDEFQNEKRNICLLMFQAGGAGLSLHNTPNNKRQRVVYLPPVWSAEELVQVLGRAHRINSQSTTYQYIVWYKDTIEEEVAAKVKIKCRALKEIVGKNENWVDAFNTSASSGERKLLSINDKPVKLLTSCDEDDEDIEQESDVPPMIDVE